MKDSLEVGREQVRDWAADVAAKHGDDRGKLRLQRAYDSDYTSRDLRRRAMAALEFPVWVTALVHYRSTQISKHKTREAQQLAGETISRREYWNKLDRAHHYLAGLQFGRSAPAALRTEE